MYSLSLLKLWFPRSVAHGSPWSKRSSRRLPTLLSTVRTLAPVSLKRYLLLLSSKVVTNSRFTQKPTTPMRPCSSPSRRRTGRRRLLVSLLDSSMEGKRVSTSESTFLQRADGRYLASAPAEFKDFIQQKAEGNKQLVDLFAGNLDVSSFPPTRIS